MKIALRYFVKNPIHGICLLIIVIILFSYLYLIGYDNVVKLFKLIFKFFITYPILCICGLVMSVFIFVYMFAFASAPPSKYHNPYESPFKHDSSDKNI